MKQFWCSWKKISRIYITEAFSLNTVSFKKTSLLRFILWASRVWMCSSQQDSRQTLLRTFRVSDSHYLFTQSKTSWRDNISFRHYPVTIYSECVSADSGLSSPPHQSALQPSCWGRCRPSSGQHGRNVCQHPETRQTDRLVLWWTSDTQQKLSIITEQQTYLNASLLLAENEAWSTGETLPWWLWWRRRSSSYHRCSCSEHEECAGTSQGWPETENTTHTHVIREAWVSQHCHVRAFSRAVHANTLQTYNTIVIIIIISSVCI